MTLAEIHGKLSSTASNANEVREDLLTSDIFGPARYLPAADFLAPFLCRAMSASHRTLALVSKHFDVQLWPKLPSLGGGYIEPDVLVVGDEGEMVMVEAKYFSGLSGANQLEAQFRTLDRRGEDQGIAVAKRSLVFLTADWVRPSAEIDEALGVLGAEERHRVFWLNWTAADSAARDALRKRPLSQEQQFVLSDIRDLLGRKSLAGFAQLPEPEDLGTPYGFDTLAVQWQDFDLSPADIYEFRKKA